MLVLLSELASLQTSTCSQSTALLWLSIIFQAHLVFSILAMTTIVYGPSTSQPLQSLHLVYLSLSKLFPIHFHTSMRAFIPLLKITRIIYVTIQESFNMTSERTKNGAPVTHKSRRKQVIHHSKPVNNEIGPYTPLQACL